MSAPNITEQDYYHVARAIKTQNIVELIHCINQGIVQFDLSYGPLGTILDYGLYFDNIELLGVIYLAIIKGQNFNNITFHPKQNNQQFVEIIKSLAQNTDGMGCYKLLFKASIMLDLNLIDFTAHIINYDFHQNYKILDVALSLNVSYPFKGLVDYLLKRGLSYEKICKLISFDIVAHEILIGNRPPQKLATEAKEQGVTQPLSSVGQVTQKPGDIPSKLINLLSSQIPVEDITQSLLCYNIPLSRLENLVGEILQDLTDLHRISFELIE